MLASENVSHSNVQTLTEIKNPGYLVLHCYPQGLLPHSRKN